MADKKAPDLKSREILVVYDQKARSKEGSGIKLRVVQYYKPGGRISDRAESAVKWGVVSYWKDEESGETRSRAKELGDRDFDELEKIDVQTKKSVYLTIKALVKNPPPIPVEAAVPGQAAGEEEAPFS